MVSSSNRALVTGLQSSDLAVSRLTPKGEAHTRQGTAGKAE